jgi:hypothetical protein
LLDAKVHSELFHSRYSTTKYNIAHPPSPQVSSQNVTTVAFTVNNCDCVGFTGTKSKNNKISDK